MAKSGCLLFEVSSVVKSTLMKTTHHKRTVKPPMYEAMCSQNTPRKNSRNESNISMKKYHHKPMLGVRSVSSSCTPYVEYKNSQEYPIKEYESKSSKPMAAVSRQANVL